MEKKEKNEKKKVTKSVKETKTTKSKKVEKDGITVFTKETKLLIRIVGIVATFFATMFSLVVFIFGIITTLAIAGGTKDQLINNNTVVTFLSRMNNYSIAEAESSISGMGNKFLFILFEVIVPALALICTMLLLVYLIMRILNYFHDVKIEKDLFTTKKYQDVKDMIAILTTILFVTFLIFNTPSFIFYVLIELFSLTTLFMYKKIVESKKN